MLELNLKLKKHLNLKWGGGNGTIFISLNFKKDTKNTHLEKKKRIMLVDVDKQKTTT